MQLPLEITYEHISRTPWLDDYIHHRVERLERICNNLMSCRVVVTRAQHPGHVGNPFSVRVELTLPPRKELAAIKDGRVEDPHVQLRPIARRAFEAMEKQLKREVEKRRGDVKRREETNALVVRLFPEQGYGFIKSPVDEEEYYFHRNAVLHGDFERLQPGTEVRFEPEMGEEGPQASTVQIINKPGVRAGHSGSKGGDTPAGWQA